MLRVSLARFSLACLLSLLWGTSGPLRGETVVGFTEAYRTIRVSTAESGILRQVLVQEGENVVAGQPLVMLDEELYRSQLEAAQQQAAQMGRLRVAQAEFSLHTRRLTKLMKLQNEGQAYVEEVARAQAEAEIAEGRLLAEEEDRQQAQLQLERAQLMLSRRAIVAPTAGYVLEVHKHVGEAVTPTDSHLLTLVQLQPLRAVFLLTREQVARLQQQPVARLRMQRTNELVDGKVEFVSALTHAESATVTVKLRIENPDQHLFAGERCVLYIPDPLPGAAR